MHLICLFYLIFLTFDCSMSDFVPKLDDYDAYGIKLAMNAHFLVLARNRDQTPEFHMQFAPFDQPTTSSQCFIEYANLTSTFIYTVVIGKTQTQNETHFFFAGERINNKSGAFVGMISYNNTNRISSSNNSTNTTSACNTDSYSLSLHSFSNYEHQEYYILGIQPSGFRTYGFSNRFVFIFDTRKSPSFNIWNGDVTWPDSTFIPHAVDIRSTFGVVAGFIRNSDNVTALYSPIIYLFNFNASDGRPFIIDQYKPMPTPNTWQDLLTNADANLYSAKYDMSISIDTDGYVLVGMQFINRVFLLSVAPTNITRLNFISRHTNGRSLGNGKSIAWLDNGIAAILTNIYTLNYVWTSSEIFFFYVRDNVFNSTSVPLSMFPNSHQLLPSNYGTIFLYIVSSPSSLALLNSQGQILILTPTLPGHYPTVIDTTSMPFTTRSSVCKPGTYKNISGIHDCRLCPTGTKNSGNSSIKCLPCLSSAFCALGSVDDVSKTVLESRSQVLPYPHSPESTIFDEILIQNMFTIKPGRCIPLSPLFWALAIAGVSVFIIIVMEILKLCVKNSRGNRIRHIVKYIFKHTDFIGEGEYWVGGLASFSVIVLVISSCTFSNAYLKQYPIEETTDSYFACDLKLRNAKFDTNVQSLAIPFKEEEKDMFGLLVNQEFTLDVDFINTRVTCDSISIQALFGTTWSTIRWLSCNNINSTLTISIVLPYQHVAVEISIDDTKPIGAVRIGLSGHGHREENFNLAELNFYKSYFKHGYILARYLPILLALTKVINETKPMEGEHSYFDGIFIGTFTVDPNSLFVSEDQYVRSLSTVTKLSVVISETPYYVKNLQQPIARTSEVVFRNLLFAVVCLEIFGLVFLFYKLLFKPLYFMLCRRKANKYKRQVKHDKPSTGDLQRPISFSNINDIDDNQLTYKF
jgi:hypothetical protein